MLFSSYFFPVYNDVLPSTMTNMDMISYVLNSEICGVQIIVYTNIFNVNRICLMCEVKDMKYLNYFTFIHNGIYGVL